MARILVIDDDQVLLDLLENLLKKEGYIVDSMISAKQALKKSDGKDYDLIIVDLRTPEMSNHEFVTIYKKTFSDKSDTAILVLSEDQTKEIMNISIEEGTDDLEQKPFNKHSFFKKIERMIEESKKKKEC